MSGVPMSQRLGQYNQKTGSSSNRFVAALVTDLDDGQLALVYIDDRVVLETVPASEYRYIVLNPDFDTERARASMRSAAQRLGFDEGVEAYIGPIIDRPESFEDLLLDDEDIFS